MAVVALDAMKWYPAPAKLNLFLHVLGRREDGYHLLQTVFRLLDWADDVGIEVTADGTLSRLDAHALIPPETDLCLRAARLLRDKGAGRGRQDGARIALRKNLPIGGGVGGGSSDAATVLIVLNRLWKLDLTRPELASIGLGLGADVPFFIHGRNALATGIGETLSTLDLPPAWYLVIASEVPVSTREIFEDPALTRDSIEMKIPPLLPGQGRNDLEAVVCAGHPGVAERLAWLRSENPAARMTGSGGCVFAAFEQEEQARALLGKMPRGFSGVVARGLDRHPLGEWVP